MQRRAIGPTGRRGFSLIELLVVIAIIALLISILLPGMCGARGASRTVKCESNMKQLTYGFFGYATDAKGWLASFSWQPGKQYSQWGDLNNNANATDAHCNQAADIVRRLTGRLTPAFNGRMVARNYTYLVLVDGGYFGSDKLPEASVACPQDAPTQLWQKTAPDQIESLVAQRLAPADGTAQYRQILPYWSSYQLVPAVWATDTGPQIISQATNDYRLYAFSPATSRFRNRRIDDFVFPGGKVVYFDLFDRHSSCKQTVFHGYPTSKQPLGFADGSVQMKRTGDANKGWNPNNPTSLTATTQYFYKPIDNGDPPSRSGTAVGDLVTGYYRWTRWGVRGVDFGGQEPTRRP